MSRPAPPLFSVVIPAYNAAAFIEKTLESVRAQTLPDYEIVVVDDGSKDDTKGVVDRWLLRHALPGRCIRQENKRIAAARNTAMRAAAGRYIALLDHDDVWCPGKLASVAAAFQEHPEAVLVCHHVNMTQDGRLVRTVRTGPAAPDMYERLLFGDNLLSTSASVFRKDKALELGGFRENPEFNTVEDYDLWIRLSKAGPFHFIDEVLSENHVTADSASSRVEYHHRNLIALVRDHFASYRGGSPGPWDRLRMRRRLSALYWLTAVALARAGAPRSQQAEYVRKMASACPLSPKALAHALLWLVGR